MFEEFSLIKRHFEGIEDIEQAVQGVNVSGVQLGHQLVKGQLVLTISPKMTYTFGKLDATLRTLGQVAPNRIMMAVMLNEEGNIFSFIAGRNILDGEIFVIPPDNDFDNRSIGPINYATISVDQHLLHDIAGVDAQINGLNWLDKRVVFRAPAWNRKMVCSKISHMTELLKQTPLPTSPIQIVQFQRQILETFIEGMVFDEQNKHENTYLSDATIVRRTEEWFNAQDPEKVLLSELCKVLNVSRRTLQRAFTNTLGMGPAHYLLLKRLSAVRRILTSADPFATRISDVAMRYGFWELGRFAVQYKRVFGERPTDTLNKKK